MEFDWTTGFIFPHINFFIFLGVLFYFGRKPLAALAKKRQEDYDLLFKAAEKAQKEAESRLAELDARLAKLDTELHGISKDAHLESKVETARILKQGEEIADQLSREASRIAEGEVNKAKLELQKEVMESVRKTVSVKVSSEFSSENQANLLRANTSLLTNLTTRS